MSAVTDILSIAESVVSIGGSILLVAIGATAVLAREWLVDTRRVEREQRFEVAQFQRKTLITLQDQLQVFIRLMGRMVYEDEMHVRRGGEWRENLFSGTLSDDYSDMYRIIRITFSRVFNEEIRSTCLHIL